MTDITRMRGDTYADECHLKSKTTGLAIPITGYTFVMTVHTKRDPLPNEPYEYQVVGTILDANEGRVEFAPLVSDVDRIGTYFYDIQLIDGAGRKRTLVKAKYMFTQDITKN